MHETACMPVGHVAGLWRYPVKSMRAEPLSLVDVGWQGLVGDRRWAFVRPGIPQSGFPWVTLRERGEMNRYRPRFADPREPDKSATLVRTPSGATLDVTDPALAEEVFPGSRVIRQDRGIFDTFPLSLITTGTIAALSASTGLDLDVARFRPNILVDAEPFAEDGWVGCVVRIGTLRLRVDKRDGRCAVITIDPETGERSPGILRAVARKREGCLGVYGTTVEPGRVAIGEAVSIERS